MSDSAKSRSWRGKDWESAIDKIIREAQERGEFDNLPGQGKPLNWDDQHVPAEWQMANRVLKNAGFAPAWIEDHKWIRSEGAALRQFLDEFVTWSRRQQEDATSNTSDLEIELRQSCEARITSFRERARKLNERIDNFNLMTPVKETQQPRMRIDDEISAFRKKLAGL